MVTAFAETLKQCRSKSGSKGYPVYPGYPPYPPAYGYPGYPPMPAAVPPPPPPITPDPATTDSNTTETEPPKVTNLAFGTSIGTNTFKSDRDESFLKTQAFT